MKKILAANLAHFAPWRLKEKYNDGVMKVVALTMLLLPAFLLSGFAEDILTQYDLLAIVKNEFEGGCR